MEPRDFSELIRTSDGPTIPGAVRDHAERWNDDLSLRFIRSDKTEGVYSYDDVYEEMRRRGQNLLRLGLEKGDKVAFVLPENEDFVLSFLGALSVGVVPVPMYPPLSFGKLDSYVKSSIRIADAADARMLLTDGKVQNVLWSMVDRVDTMERLVTVDELHKPVEGEPDIDDLSHDDVAFLQFTSGSTALPKGVVVTHGSLLANLDGIMNIGLEINEQDVAVSWLPLYHDMGLIGFMLAPVWYAVPTHYMPTLEFVKHPWKWMKLMDEVRGSIAFAPNFAYALARKRTKDERLQEMDLSCVKVLGCGAEPNHPDTLQSFVDHFEPARLKPHALLPCYGMAEATLAMTFVGLDEEMTVDVVDGETYSEEGVATPSDEIDEEEIDALSRLEYVSCGRPFPDHEIVIVDEAGNELPERHVGEIVFRGPSVAPGYYKEPEKTAEAFTELGLRTGDLGYVADGELYVTGRKKDVLIINGRNYDPQSIEWIVQEMPGVRKGNVVAFSIEGDRTEELVIAAEVKSGADRKQLARDITKTVQEELFLRPSDVHLVGRGQLPKTTSGKLQRTKTREQYLDGSLGEEGVRTMGARGDKLTLAKHVAKSAVSRARHKVKNGARDVLTKINPLASTRKKPEEPQV